MPDDASSLKTLVKRLTWLSLPLLLATFLLLQVKTGEPVAAAPESIPPKETKVMSRALHFVENNYVDPQLINPFRMLRNASMELERGIAPLIIREKDESDDSVVEVMMGEKKMSLPVPNPITLDTIPPLLGRLLGFLDLFYKGRLEEQEREYMAMGG